LSGGFRGKKRKEKKKGPQVPYNIPMALGRLRGEGKKQLTQLGRGKQRGRERGSSSVQHHVLNFLVTGRGGRKKKKKEKKNANVNFFDDLHFENLKKMEKEEWERHQV